jgi:hypothetical protein
MSASTSFAMVLFSATSFEIGEMRGGEGEEEEEEEDEEKQELEGKRKGIIRGEMSVRSASERLDVLM